MLQLKFYTVLMTLLVVSMVYSPSFSNTASAATQPQNIVKAGDFVTLSGTGTDPDDDFLTVQWKQVGGEPVTLSSTTVAEPTFTAPEVENGMVKILTFELTVTDPYGATDKDTLKITVLPRNQPPTADAGSDQTVNKNDQVTLNGDGSDPDGDALYYHWSQIDGPIVELSDANDQNASFDTSSMPRSSGILRFQLTVTDGYGGLARDSVVIKVNAAKATLITADAGDDQTVDEGTNVQLDGSCNDKLNREFSYRWVQTLGPFAPLSSTTSADPTFTAPEIANGQMVPTAFRLTCAVGDGGGSSTDVVIIRINPVNDIPVADAGPDKNTLSNRLVILAGSGSDPDGDALKYTWKQVGGEDVDLLFPNRSELKFTAPEVFGGDSTTLEFELTATDPYGAKGTDTVTVTVTSDNARPSADAGLDQTVDEQTSVTLSGSAEDPDSEDITYTWKQVGGEAVELSSTDEQNPTFIAPIVANGKIKVLVFELRAADEHGRPSKDTTKVYVLPVNSAPVVDAGIDQTVDVDATVMLAGSASDEDGEQLTYLWSQIGGQTVSLSSTTDLDVTFVAPKTELDTKLTFQLVANDGTIDSAPDTVDVVVKGITTKAITAYAGKDQNVNEHVVVTLFGSGKDPLKHNLSYSWSQLSGEPVVLSSSTLAKPSFESPDVDNEETKTLVFELTVSDGTGRSAKDSVKITVGPINGDPTAFAKVKSTREPV
ncbi:PKD domain-containing protein [Candidatus Nitrosotenuis chungbukensis]|uniref:PKD domain-containing protein n=1 Tax=Candidatus Nitrosotenuis chungbukensis TaxID=1353246 RepID=UPI0012FF333A|nr:PKD domain-containing protein [Candidatus Nitrosotenuis chungbukensis]